MHAGTGAPPRVALLCAALPHVLLLCACPGGHLACKLLSCPPSTPRRPRVLRSPRRRGSPLSGELGAGVWRWSTPAAAFSILVAAPPGTCSCSIGAGASTWAVGGKSLSYKGLWAGPVKMEHSRDMLKRPSDRNDGSRLSFGTAWHWTCIGSSTTGQPPSCVKSGTVVSELKSDR